jgi:hypothetical protein
MDTSFHLAAIQCFSVRIVHHRPETCFRSEATACLCDTLCKWRLFHPAADGCLVWTGIFRLCTPAFVSGISTTVFVGPAALSLFSPICIPLYPRSCITLVYPTFGIRYHVFKRFILLSSLRYNTVSKICASVANRRSDILLILIFFVKHLVHCWNATPASRCWR